VTSQAITPSTISTPIAIRIHPHAGMASSLRSVLSLDRGTRWEIRETTASSAASTHVVPEANIRISANRRLQRRDRGRTASDDR
jgi:hypothetical protein